MTYEEAYNVLKQYDQLHLLEYYEKLNAGEQEKLLDQIANIDFSVLAMCKKGHQSNTARGVIQPLAAMQLPQIEKKREEYTHQGMQAIRQGKVAALLLAGGMGTRLGSDDPKGMYNIGITKNVYIFERLICNLLDVVKLTGAWIPLFIMTSDKNHQATVSFLQAKEFFGYKEEEVTFFMQDMAPATDYQGKIYLEDKGFISMSPNGNGGWFSSMIRSGALKKATDRGVEWINLFAVDNVLQRIADPCFIGATIATQSAVGAKVVKKVAPDEKVGVMCLEDGKPTIIEYYELTEKLMNEVDEDGDPAYNFGVILNYLFRIEDLQNSTKLEIPVHIVEKKISYVENGVLIKPEKPNGYKFETLVLDMIHLADSCLPYEVVREYEFAPIKNKEGVDSVESARKLCTKNGITL